MNQQINELAQKLAMIGFRELFTRADSVVWVNGLMELYINNSGIIISYADPALSIGNYDYNDRDTFSSLVIQDITNYQKIINGIKILEEWVK